MLGEPHGNLNGDDRDFREANPAGFGYFFSVASVATGAVDNNFPVLSDATGTRRLFAFLEALAGAALRAVSAWSSALWRKRHRGRSGGLAESAQRNVPLWFARGRRTTQALAMADRCGAGSVSGPILLSDRASNTAMVRGDATGRRDLQRSAHRVEEPSAVRRPNPGELSTDFRALQLAESCESIAVANPCLRC